MHRKEKYNKLLDFKNFIDNVLEDYQEKVLVSIRMSIGLRKNKKYTFLHSNVFYFGNYVSPNDLKYSLINGYIHKNSSSKKTFYLTISNSFTQDLSEFLSIPVLDFNSIVLFLYSFHLTSIYLII